ncbi:MAG TPA: glycosyltransferase family 4 protein [Flavobacteriaceae bacterium]|nr:glycosyltransferase family 4 protein [Flavobacteriaceae bacterium]
MASAIIYVFHKQGAKNHFVALEFLAKKKGLTVKYREFSVVTKFFKSIRTSDFKMFFEQFVNLGFMIGLVFSRQKKIVLGIAPFDYQLGFLLKILKNHYVYYHSSWSCWDKSFHPKKKKLNQKVFENWKYFLEKKAVHIFCVNKQGKNELIKNYNLPENNISVVHHALNPIFATREFSEKKEKSFIYYGRLVPQKGIEEVLNYFSQNKKATFTVIGDGKLKPMLEKHASENKNIRFLNKISNKKELKKEIAQHEYLVLNSLRNSKWEELFGLVIIESMSQGVVPISTKHSGPKEIIKPETGFLFEEGNLSAALDLALSLNSTERQTMAKNGIQESKKYLPEKIAEKWKAIL